MSHTHSGQITIEPALNWAEIRTVSSKIQQMVSKAGGSRHTRDAIVQASADELRYLLGFGLEIVSDARETEDGTLQVKLAPALSYYTSEGASYLIEADVINMITKLCPGHTLNGTLVMVHEEGTQGTKTTVKDNKVSATSGIAYMRWADGTEDRVSQII